MSKKIEECLGFHFEKGQVVHTFGDTASSITVNGLDICYEEPSRISDNHDIKVVFFKENLSTGWDCPRAETMMSFRRAVDPTYIAQLLGRMVRTPIQRHIDGDDVLNDVHLYLPYFDEVTVKQVVDALQKGDIPVHVTTNEYQTLTTHFQEQQQFDRSDVVKFINGEGLATYKIKKKRTASYLELLFDLIHLLSRSGIDTKSWQTVKSEIVEKIHDYIDDLKNTGKYDESVLTVKKFELWEKTLDALGNETGNYAKSIFTTTADIDRQFRFAENKFRDEGIGIEYGRKYNDPNDPSSDAFKIDVILYAFENKCMEDLEKYAETKFNKLQGDSRLKIIDAEEQHKSQFNEIIDNTGDDSIPGVLCLPETIKIPIDKDVKEYDNHLFIDENTKKAKISLNSWEELTLKEESQREDFVCWIRNVPNASWALAIPYEKEDGKKKLAYPDFIIVRKDGNQGYVIDILEPHGESFDDNFTKAKGLAKYAKENKDKKIGRIQLLRMQKGCLRRLDMMDISVQKEVLNNMANSAQLDNIFKNKGFQM